MKTTKTLRKITAVILSIILIIGAIPIVNAVGTDEEVRSGDFSYYVLDDGTIRISAYYGGNEYLEIPEKIDGYEVSIIGRYGALWFFNEGLKAFNTKSISLPKTIKGFVYNEASSAFENWNSIENIKVDEENLSFSSQDGILYDSDLKSLLFYPEGKKDSTYILPEGLEKIELNSILKNKFLKKIYLGKNLSFIDDKSFSGFSDLKIYVYSDSYGLEWAKEHTFPYVIMDDTIEDKETGITVSDINSDAKVSVSPDDISSTEIENAEEAFSISMLNVSEEIENVNISIPATKRLLVCKKTSNGIEEIKSSYNDEKISFETNSTSGEFVLYSPLWGDSNSDKEINIEDATIIQKFCSKKAELSLKLEQIADVNNDQKVDILDSTTIQKQIAKIK